MSDSYYFDKRKMKRTFGKYGIIFLISFVPIVLFNVFVGKYISQNWLVVFLDCVFLLIFVCIGNMIANKIFERKDAKLEARRKEREELDKRKQQILEDSYKQKRAQKLKLKEEKKNIEEKDTDETMTESSEEISTKEKSKGRKK